MCHDQFESAALALRRQQAHGRAGAGPGDARLRSSPSVPFAGGKTFNGGSGGPFAAPRDSVSGPLEGRKVPSETTLAAEALVAGQRGLALRETQTPDTASASLVLSAEEVLTLSGARRSNARSAHGLGRNRRASTFLGSQVQVPRRPLRACFA